MQIDKTHSHSLHLYDDPRSQIHFLELTLGDREWRATVHVPPQFGGAASIRRELESRGYVVAQTQDAQGHTELSLHHLGASPDVPKLFKDYGLTHGASYVISHPVVAAKTLVSGATNAAASLRDPARLNGLVYLTSEAFLLRAAAGNPHGHWYTPKNFMQGLSASCLLSQSLAYLFLAKKGEDKILGDLSQRLDVTGASDGSNSGFNALAGAPIIHEEPRHGVLGKVRGLIEEHPIQAGAIFNNAGMIAYLGHAILERRFRQGLLKINPHDTDLLHYINKGFWTDVVGTSISLAGWSSLLLKSKEYDEYSENPVVRVYQKWRENPQAAAGFSTLFSSSGRLYGAYKKGNTYQMIGESIYIPGDLLLFFVKNHEYGGSIGDNLESMGKAASELVLQQPLLVSPSQQHALFDQTAHYLARQVAALSDKPVDEAQTQQKLTELLTEGCAQTLTQRFEDAKTAMQQLIDVFPAGNQEAVRAALLKAAPTLLGAHIDAAQDLQSLTVAKEAPATHMPSEDELAKRIGAVALCGGEQLAAQNTLSLLQQLEPLLEMPQPNHAPKSLVSSAALAPSTHAAHQPAR